MLKAIASLNICREGTFPLINESECNWINRMIIVIPSSAIMIVKIIFSSAENSLFKFESPLVKDIDKSIVIGWQSQHATVKNQYCVVRRCNIQRLVGNISNRILLPIDNHPRCMQAET